jgi:hypothetical protein
MSNKRRKEQMKYLWTSPSAQWRFIPVMGLKIGQLGVIASPVGGEVIHINSGRNLANCSNVLIAARLAQELEKRGFDFDLYWEMRQNQPHSEAMHRMQSLQSSERNFIHRWLEDHDPEDPLY